MAECSQITSSSVQAGPGSAEEACQALEGLPSAGGAAVLQRFVDEGGDVRFEAQQLRRLLSRLVQGEAADLAWAACLAEARRQCSAGNYRVSKVT